MGRYGFSKRLLLIAARAASREKGGDFLRTAIFFADCSAGCMFYRVTFSSRREFMATFRGVDHAAILAV